MTYARRERALRDQLRELESDGLIDRKVFQQVPPKVEYSLSRRGKSLGPILSAMGAWGKKYAAVYEVDIEARTKAKQRAMALAERF